MQDCPDGQYHTLEKTGKKQRSKPWRELYNGVTNYRMWGLAACYAYSFGVEVRSPALPMPSSSGSRTLLRLASAWDLMCPLTGYSWESELSSRGRHLIMVCVA